MHDQLVVANGASELISAVSGLAPADAVWMFGTEGTLHLDAGANGLYGGRKGDGELSEMLISAEKRGGWRVEEEFISAIRGLEPVTHTNFEDGVRYIGGTIYSEEEAFGG